MKIDSYHHRRLVWPVSLIDIQCIMHGFIMDGHIYMYTCTPAVLVSFTGVVLSPSGESWLLSFSWWIAEEYIQSTTIWEHNQQVREWLEGTWLSSPKVNTIIHNPYKDQAVFFIWRGCPGIPPEIYCPACIPRLLLDCLNNQARQLYNMWLIYLRKPVYNVDMYFLTINLTAQSQRSV